LLLNCDRDDGGQNSFVINAVNESVWPITHEEIVIAATAEAYIHVGQTITL